MTNDKIVPTYLPAAAIRMSRKDGGAPVTVFRPYEAFSIADLERHAQKNECGSLLQLGERCFYGRLGAEKDYVKAYDYLRRAAELGAQDAQFLLAFYYTAEDIPIVAKDYAKCRDMLTLAAENGSWKAMEKLALLYNTGIYQTKIDHEKAFEWALEAERLLRIYWDFYTQPNFVDFAEKQKEILHAHTGIVFTISRDYADGMGTKRDLKQAAEWIDKGEAFVCKATGLAKVPMFQERRAQLMQRMKKDEARAEKAARDKKK